MAGRSDGCGDLGVREGLKGGLIAGSWGDLVEPRGYNLGM
jgi:hypothetical protein